MKERAISGSWIVDMEKSDEWKMEGHDGCGAGACVGAEWSGGEERRGEKRHREKRHREKRGGEGEWAESGSTECDAKPVTSAQKSTRSRSEQLFQNHGRQLCTRTTLPSVKQAALTTDSGPRRCHYARTRSMYPGLRRKVAQSASRTTGTASSPVSFLRKDAGAKTGRCVFWPFETHCRTPFLVSASRDFAPEADTVLPCC